MARDTKANAAYDSGLRGSEKPRKAATGEPELKSGATELSIRRAENGYIVNCTYPPKKEKGRDYMGWQPPTPHVFATAAEVATFIESELGTKSEKK
jgi:hypothetical protein